MFSLNICIARRFLYTELKSLLERSSSGISFSTSCANPAKDSSEKEEPLVYRLASYDELAKNAVQNPNEFWAEQADQVDWFKRWDRVLDNDNPPFTRWFTGGKLNACYNAVDRHVNAGRGKQTAIIHDSPVTSTITKLTYKDLLDKVKCFAGVLRGHGVAPGDRVLIYMPMIPEVLVAMLACARLGAVHSVVFGGFAAKELSVRIDHCEPKVIVAASAGIEPSRIQPYKPILDEAIRLATHKPLSSILYQRPDGVGEMKLQTGEDYDWDTEMDRARPVEDCVAVDASHPLYIIYTSGTTGLPKGVVRPTAGYTVMLPWTMEVIYGMRRGQTWWAASDLGWVVGHSYICYAPLMYGAKTVLFEGKPVGTPNAGQYFRVISQHDVRSMFAAPTALRAIRQEDYECHHGAPYKKHNWKLNYVFPAGEHLDYETRVWAEDKLGVPTLDHWWQTESGFPMAATCVGVKDPELNPPVATSGKPVPGWDISIMKEDASGETAEPGELGHIMIKLPLPPGFCSTFWNNDEKFSSTYFDKIKGYYDSMDAGMMQSDNFLSVMSRVDDVINVAGHRISGGAIEEAILQCHHVADTAVIAVDDKLKGARPVAICVLADGVIDEEFVQKEVVAMVRQSIGPVAALKDVLVVPKLPKTRAGKIARNTLAAMANNKPYSIPVTIEDASVYPAIHHVMVQHGFAHDA